jgi:hypothetical protein
MAVRYSYSNPYQVNELAMYEQQLMMHQSGARRFFSAIGRFFYRLIVLTLIVGTVGGVLFALYKNDVLLQIARGAGIETQFRSFEKAIGAKGWGPRTVQPPSETADIAAAAAPASEASNPSEKQAETVRAAVTSEPKTANGVAIVSFDSLPTVSTKAKSEPVAAEPVERAKPTRSEPMSIAQAVAAGPSRPAPKPKAEKPKPAKPTELTRSIPLPKAPPKPEPVAAKPEPKPEPPPPKPVPEEDHTKPRSGDNPLKAAIRASMAGKKPE